MHEFSVWAPRAKSVAVCIEGRDTNVPLVRSGEWWRVADAEADFGTRYKYVIDEGEATPDPRSRFQPEGVHGWSEVVDPNSFAWQDQQWRGVNIARTVIYEMHVGTFSAEGTFLSAIERLDYLVELGIEAVEIMPVVEFSGERGWGYDGVDLYATHHAYGRPDDLKQLVDACHGRGLGVVFDVVYNHLGPDGNYLSSFGPYFTDEFQTPWGDAINYGGELSGGVRQFVVDNAAMWLAEFHGDGLRLDAVHSIVDKSKQHIVADIVMTANKIAATRQWPAWIIAESDLNDPVVIEPVDSNGYGADAQWSDDFHHSLHALLTGEDAGYYEDYGGPDFVVTALNENFVYTGEYSKFRDEPRGKPASHYPPQRFIGYLQNHDQIGNRAAGERIGTMVEPGLVYVGAALVLLGPFIPMVFQGEEWAASTPFMYFTDHSDAELASAVTEGRKKEFAAALSGDAEVPDPQDANSFLASKLNWAEIGESSHESVLNWYRTLIQLRRVEDAFSASYIRASVHADVITMDRGQFVVVANVGPRGQTHDVDDVEVVLTSDERIAYGNAALTMAPFSVGVLRRLSAT